MLQQLQNLASYNIIHAYQTCLLVESFFPRIGAWTDVVCRIPGRRLFGVEFQVCWLSNISAPILQFLCLLDLCACNESETFLKCLSIFYRPPCSRVQFLNFVNKIFVILRLITKFMKIWSYTVESLLAHNDHPFLIHLQPTINICAWCSFLIGTEDTL